MTDKDKKDVKGELTPESMKAIAESVGIAHMSDEAAAALVEDATYRIKQVLQVCEHVK